MSPGQSTVFDSATPFTFMYNLLGCRRVLKIFQLYQYHTSSPLLFVWISVNFKPASSSSSGVKWKWRRHSAISEHRIQYMCSIEADLVISFLYLIRATGVYACWPMFIYPLGEGKGGHPASQPTKENGRHAVFLHVFIQVCIACN